MPDYNYPAAREAAGHIPGWLNPDEAARLYYVGFHADGNILEVGTYFGKSTYLLARGIRDAGKRHKVVTIDIHHRGLDPQTGKELILAEDSPLAVCRNLKMHGLEDTVIQMIGWSRDCIPLLDLGTFTAVFIDAGHDYESCSQDFLKVRGRLAPEQRVQFLFHDNEPCTPGVQRTINELVRTDPRFQYVADVQSLFCCELVPETDCRRSAA